MILSVIHCIITAMRKLNPEQVRTLLGVSNHSLKYYRDPARLPGGKANPLYLPCIADEKNPNIVWYSTDEVMDFVHRNEKFRDHFLAKWAPKDVTEAVTTPLAVPVPSRQPTIRAGLLGALTIPTTPETTTE